jgi:hypothetical protein
MARPRDHAAGEAAAKTGIYELFNIFGSPTGIRVNMAQGQPLPSAPLGHTWVPAKDPTC